MLICSRYQDIIYCLPKLGIYNGAEKFTQRYLSHFLKLIRKQRSFWLINLGWDISQLWRKVSSIKLELKAWFWKCKHLRSAKNANIANIFSLFLSYRGGRWVLAHQMLNIRFSVILLYEFVKLPPKLFFVSWNLSPWLDWRVRVTISCNCVTVWKIESTREVGVFYEQKIYPLQHQLQSQSVICSK